MTAPTRIEHPTIADGRAHGKSLPTQAGLSSHTGWEPATDRADPVSCSRSRTPTSRGQARADARSGGPIAIAAYLGNSDEFDRSIAELSERYADQNDQDYQPFVEAVRSDRLEAIEGI